ncbi:hypothetical protein BGZ46_004359 [Entomortierella lignicola]|nr:hypothetical protein BGZ46_004359 [Entomortierella lignicola]
MDTAVLKSWSEVVRLTDPLIWSIAMEGNSIAATATESDTAFDASLSSLNYHQYQQQQPQQQQNRIDSFSASHATPSTSPTSPPSPVRDSISGSRTYKNNFCRSLLDPHPRNTLDWLKCLIQTSQEDTSRDHSYHNHIKKDRQITLDTQMDFGLVGEAISKRAKFRGNRNYSRDNEEAVVVLPDIASFGVQPNQQSQDSNSPLVSKNENHAEESRASTFTGSGSESPVTASSSNLSNSSPNSPNTPTAPDSAVSLAAVAAAAVAAHRNANAETRSKNSLEKHTASLSDGAFSTSHAHSSESSNSATSFVSRANSGNTAVSSNSNAEGVTSTNTKTSSRLSGIVPSLDHFHSAAGMVQSSIIKTKNATTAFMYRTFSPTYRISRLYIDSWSNGSQMRGLERIKNSIVRGDAFTLVRGTTTQMKDIWGQVMSSYRAKRHSKKIAKITSKTTRQEKNRSSKKDTNANQSKDRESGISNSSTSNSNNNSNSD